MTCRPPLFITTISAMIFSAPSFAQTESSDLPDGNYYIASSISNKMLTARQKSDGSVDLVQWTKNPGLECDQIWALKKDRNGYRIYSAKHNQDLSFARAAKNASRTTAILTNIGTGKKTTWCLHRDGNGYSISPQPSLRKINLNAPYGHIGDGAPVELDRRGVDENEYWLLYRVDQVTGQPGSRQPAQADRSTYDNHLKRYRIAPLPAAAFEANRLNRRKLADFHPSGLFVKKGEAVTIEARGIPDSPDGLVIVIRPMGLVYARPPDNEPSSIRAREGRNDFTAPRSGMMYFRYGDNGLSPTSPSAIELRVIQGGTAVPLYINGVTTAAQWADMLKRYSRTRWVEMIGDRTMVSVRRSIYDRTPPTDPAALFTALDNIVRLEDDISGLDSETALHRPSPLRLHYVQDDVTRGPMIEYAYMYAGDYIIGMLGDSATDLLDPRELQQAWSIWHETGHMYQQNDWTWEQVLETTVNIYSLYVQERLGQPSRLEERDPGTGLSTYEDARRYLDSPARDFNDDRTFPAHADPVWVRLVMYEQLRKGLGDSFFRKLHQYYRVNPLHDDQPDPDDKKIQSFIYRSSLVANLDLTDFFTTWGLRVDASTAAAVRSLKLPPAPANLVKIGLEAA